jgi:hypothetical protein
MFGWRAASVSDVLVSRSVDFFPAGHSARVDAKRRDHFLLDFISSACTRDDFTTGFSQRLAVREFNIVAIRVAKEAQITSVGVQKCGTEL